MNRCSPPPNLLKRITTGEIQLGPVKLGCVLRNGVTIVRQCQSLSRFKRRLCDLQMIAAMKVKKAIKQALFAMVIACTEKDVTSLRRICPVVLCRDADLRGSTPRVIQLEGADALALASSYFCQPVVRRVGNSLCLARVSVCRYACINETLALMLTIAEKPPHRELVTIEGGMSIPGSRLIGAGSP